MQISGCPASCEASGEGVQDILRRCSLTHFSAAQEQEQEQERGFTAIVAKEFHRNFCLFQVSLQHSFTATGCFTASLVFGILPSFSRLRDL